MNVLAKKALIFTAVMAVVAASGWFGRKAYKRVTERRLISEARQYGDKHDFRNEALCLQRALQVNPLSLAAARSMGDLLESAGVPNALSWRMRAAQLDPRDPELRLAWAQTALKLRNLQSAEAALAGLEKQSQTGAVYHKLAGALAWGSGHASEAEQNYAEALRLEPTNQTVRFNLATVRLSSTNTATSQSGQSSLEQMASGSDFKLPALHYLLKDALGHKLTSQALGYSESIVRDSAATVRDRVDHLQLLREAKSPDFGSWRAALQAEGTRSSVAAFTLGQWMATVEGPTNALQWLISLPAAIQTNQPAPLIIADCLLFQRNWPGLQSLVQAEDWDEANFFRLALQSLAQRSQDQALASQGSWARALQQAAHHVDRLTRLSQLSAKWGWNDEYSQVLRRIVSEFPNEHWATDQLIAYLYAAGNSHDLAELLRNSYNSDPSNPRLKNNLATISMLRKSGLEMAYRLAREAYESSPKDPFFISTYAYSLLLQNQTNAAVKMVSELTPESLSIPTIAAYYGVVESQVGHKEAAREPLLRAEGARLLPEEKEMVRLAKASL